jgi:hypothetical protein
MPNDRATMSNEVGYERNKLKLFKIKIQNFLEIIEEHGVKLSFRAN